MLLTSGWAMNRGILLERRTHRHHRQVLLHQLDGLQVVAHHQVGLPGEQQLHHVDLRPAHADFDVEPVLAIRSLGHRLIEAAVLGLRQPVGQEHDLGRALGRGERRSDRARRT
jgi:hypothetical protein